MKRLALRVDTISCEADESDVLDELLAHEGVLAAELDLREETLRLSYDEQKTTKSALLDHLRFFGLAPRGDTLLRSA
jgi:hypothetical protein